MISRLSNCYSPLGRSAEPVCDGEAEARGAVSAGEDDVRLPGVEPPQRGIELTRNLSKIVPRADRLDQHALVWRQPAQITNVLVCY